MSLFSNSYFKLQAIPIDDIRNTMYDIPESREFYDRVLTQKPADSCFRWFTEDLFSGDVAADRVKIANLYTFLKVTPIVSREIDRLLDPMQVKLNSRATYRLIPNADDIEAELGSDETGWLFDAPEQTIFSDSNSKRYFAARRE